MKPVSFGIAHGIVGAPENSLARRLCHCEPDESYGGTCIGCGDPTTVAPDALDAKRPGRHKHETGTLEGKGYTATWMSIKGRKRRQNQDQVRCFLGRLAGRPVMVGAVFDGVGGLPGGKEAAHLAAEGLPHALRDAAGPEEVLPNLHAGLPGATTATVACLLLEGGELVILHAGDSAAHTWDDGWQRLTPCQDVDQALGLHPEPFVLRMEAPDRLLVVSDGVELQGPLDGEDLAQADDASYILIERSSP